MINIAIIGYGYWGPNLLRNFNANSSCNVKYLVDGREDRLKIAKNQYPNIETVTNIESIIITNIKNFFHFYGDLNMIMCHFFYLL